MTDEPPSQMFLGYQNREELAQRALDSGMSQVEAGEYAELATTRCIDATPTDFAQLLFRAGYFDPNDFLRDLVPGQQDAMPAQEGPRNETRVES